MIESAILQDDTEYFIQYQEPGMFPDWWRLPPIKGFGSFKDAFEKIENVLKAQHPEVLFRVEQVVTKRIILWSMEDGDE